MRWKIYFIFFTIFFLLISKQPLNCIFLFNLFIFFISVISSYKYFAILRVYFIKKMFWGYFIDLLILLNFSYCEKLYLLIWYPNNYFNFVHYRIWGFSISYISRFNKREILMNKNMSHFFIWALKTKSFHVISFVLVYLYFW